MATVLELMQIDRVDSNGHSFSEAALRSVAEQYAQNPDLFQHVTMGYSDKAKPVQGVTGVEYRNGAVFVTLEGEAEEVAKAQGLATAATGYTKPSEEVDGVRHFDEFQFTRIALVDPDKKIG